MNLSAFITQNGPVREASGLVASLGTSFANGAPEGLGYGK